MTVYISKTQGVLGKWGPSQYCILNLLAGLGLLGCNSSSFVTSDNAMSGRTGASQVGVMASSKVVYERMHRPTLDDIS